VGGNANFVATGNAITIDNNATTNFGTVTFTGSNVTIVETSSMTVSGASSATGNLNLTANGFMNQAAGSSITGNAAATFNAGAGNDITFNNAANDFGSVAITAGNVVNLFDTNTLVLAASAVSGNYTVAANGSITTSGNLALNGTASTIHAQTASADLTISHNINHATNAGTLILRADRNVAFATGGNVASTGVTLDVTVNADRDGASGGAISMASGTQILSNGGNIVLGGGSAGTGAAVGVTGGAGIALTGATLDAGAGAITLQGNGSATGGIGITLGTSTLRSTSGTIDITGVGVTAGNAGVQLTGGTTVGATGSGNVRLTGTGATGADSGVATSGGTNVLGNAAASGDILLRSLGGNISTDATILTTGNVTFNSPAGVAQTGGSVGNATVAGKLHLLGTGTFNIQSATNNVATLAANVNGNLAFTDASGFTIGTITSNSGVTNTTTNGITTTGNPLRLTAGGQVTQLTANNVTATTLELLGTGGNFQLTNTTNNVGTLAANTGTVNYTNAANLTVGVIGTTSGITATGPVTLTTTASNTQTVSNTIVAGGLVTFNNGGLLTLNADVTGNGGITQTGGTVTITGPRTLTTSGNAISFGSNVTLAGGANNTTLNTTSGAAAGANVTFAGTIVGSTGNTERLFVNAGTGGDITFNQAVGNAGTPLGNLTITNARHVNFNSTTNASRVLQSAGTGNTTITGDMTALGGGIDLTADRISITGNLNTGTQDLRLNAANGVIQNNGFIASNQVLLLSTGTGSFTLLQPNNNVATRIAANVGGDLSFLNGGNVTVGDVTIGASSANGIVTNGGNLTLRSANGATVVSSNINTGAGNIVLNANGTLTGSGTITGNVLTMGNLGTTTAIGPLTTRVNGVNATASNGAIQISNNSSAMTLQAAATNGLVNVLTTGSLTTTGAVTSSNANVTLTAGNGGSGGMTISHNVTGPTGANLTVEANDAFLTHNGGTLSTTNAAINLVADEMNLAATVNSGTANITVRPFNAADQIQLGAASAGTNNTGNALELASSEINTLNTTGVLTIGGNAHSGQIQVIGSTSVSTPSTLLLQNTTGGINVGDQLTFTGATGNLSFNTTGAVTRSGSGAINSSTLKINSGTGANIALNNANTNLFITNSTGGVEILVNSGDLLVQNLVNNGTGGLTIGTVNGSITTSGNQVVVAGGAVSLVANATDGTNRNLTIGTGGLSGAGAITLKSADNMTFQGRVQTSSGDVLLIAGKAPGMTLVTPATESVQDTVGTITFNAPVTTSSGSISIYSTGHVLQPANSTDQAGVQGTGTLTVRTYNDADQQAVINMQNTHSTLGNSNPDIILETRKFADTSAPSEPSGDYAASDIDYKSITGLTLKGVGTGANYSATATTQSITVATFNIQAKNMTLIANAGDINVNAQIDKSKINRGLDGGSLNLLAAGDIKFNANSSVQGVSVGKVVGTKTDVNNFGDPLVEYFNHDLRLVATNNITIQGGVWITGNLSLRADASSPEVVSLAGALGSKGSGNGQGGVTLENNSTSNPLEIRALNIIVGERSGTNFFSSEFLTLKAGSGTAAAGSNLRVDTVLRAGIPVIENASQTSTAVTGGRVDIILSGGLNLTGGTINGTSNGAGTQVRNSALVAVRGTDVYICHPSGCDVAPVGYNPANTIRMQGGTATASNTLGGGAVAAADAIIVASLFKRIVIGGDIIMIGGTANRSGSAQPSAGVLIDPVQELVIRTGGSIVLQSGTGTGGATSAGARIVNEGNITMFIGGGSPGSPSKYTFTDPTLGSVILGPGLIMIGGAGTGVFDAANLSLDGTAPPITFVFGQGGVVKYQPVALAGSIYSPAIVQTGVNSFDENLLRYIIFSQLDAAKADRIRRGLSDDDIGGAACQ